MKHGLGGCVDLCEEGGTAGWLGRAVFSVTRSEWQENVKI